MCRRPVYYYRTHFVLQFFVFFSHEFFFPHELVKQLAVMSWETPVKTLFRYPDYLQGPLGGVCVGGGVREEGWGGGKYSH